MTTGKSRALAAAAALVAAAGLAGCGEKCKTEPVAKVEEAQSCTAAPGAPVSVGVRLCPTCNQTGATCEVDTSQAASGIIQLDPVVEACEDVTTCPTQEPACQVAPLPCRFSAPAAPGAYEIVVYDPQTNTLPTVATLEVVAGAPSSCAFAAAFTP